MATPTINFYYWDGDSWEDISEHVRADSVSGSWGMKSDKYTDRLASTGEMTMTLDNTTGRFDPDDAQVLTGWGINTKVKLVVTFDGVSYTRFYGTVENISMSDPSIYDHTANVTVVDWMDYAYKFPLTQQSIETYVRGDQAVDTIVTATGRTPLATNYAEGDYEFPAAFDSMTVTTKASTELNKIVLSESGYFYNRHDKVNGETLVFESASYRNGLRTVSKIPVITSSCGYWLTEGGDYVLTEGGDKIILDEVQDAHMDGEAAAYSRNHGENILNKVTVTAYPKRIDTSEQTIYSLGTPLMLAPGETKTVTVKYQNATTKEGCNAITSLCSQPVETTDYLMNRNKAGTGANITTSLSVSVVFYTAEAAVTYTNSSAYTGYVTRLYLKGYGVYQDSPIKAMAEDSTSQTAYGMQELNIEQRYQRDTSYSETEMYQMMYAEKDPRTKLVGVSFIANKSDKNMMAFLSIDIGDMIKITESSLNLDDYFYVNGVEFSVQEGNVIMFKWILATSLALILPACTAISLDFNNSVGQSMMYNNEVADLEQMTVMVSFDMDSFGDTSLPQVLIEREPIWMLYVGTSSESVVFVSSHTGSSGFWKTDDSSFTTGQHHIALTYDNSSADNDPVMYIDGSSEGVTEVIAPVGDKVDQENIAIRIGSYDTSGAVAKSPNGNVKYVKFYNRILSALEVASEVATPGSVTDGLVFYAPVVPSSTTAYFDGRTLTTTDILFDNVEWYIGHPYGSPVSQLIP